MNYKRGIKNLLEQHHACLHSIEGIGLDYKRIYYYVGVNGAYSVSGKDYKECFLELKEKIYDDRLAS